MPSQLAIRATSELIDREGGERYTNRAADRGGPTRWGITQPVARAYGYQGDMKVLPRETAEAIYAKNYWDLCKCDDIAKYSEELAIYVFDYAVNSGAGTAALELQGLLNVFNNRQKLYPDFVPAPNIGPKTLSTLGLYAKVRDISVLTDSFNSMRKAFLLNLAKKSEDQEENVYGWVTRVINLAKHVGVK
ncbi:hypothetical protein pEaSNUABM14_00200 [Erwinia phage pEa_SNUABM_14]|uniref:Endolysin n=1 Tax=Erwinia phage pEa_SNUABM_7 TaxID=2866695 RepID=A0AAE8BKN6_9CAUD|nr:endolysin [Erwinia phage pEa_SNUABM_7]QYW03160.1 hypothetical protein pEaSNUABM13_00201 [Erwinia phage pEa_SNUABM_13]QYW04525.1 hypothetical protein pEaSNUABM14_00200 [Erwinia phage pEa_SNUABM_14]QYW05214.1 hypothetical protein pEaSNUABM21_00200 [Erwinia phage pEa_SNUABM_21]QYW05556.1 hypothetical protein pEaSNUABM25_00200 [Erwinia phage pEa_SNUABM_25]QYW04869.1 hypothetical protein pEaSNUABM7_00201 [Erwinia phage pEa_SNUABM_7]